MIRQYRAVYDLPSRMYAEVQLTGESSEDVAIALVEAEVKEQTGYGCAEITKVQVTNNPNLIVSVPTEVCDECGAEVSAFGRFASDEHEKSCSLFTEEQTMQAKPKRPLAPVTREQRADFAEAHAEGCHDEFAREFCPECEHEGRRRE